MATTGHWRICWLHWSEWKKKLYQYKVNTFFHNRFSSWWLFSLLLMCVRLKKGIFFQHVTLSRHGCCLLLLLSSHVVHFLFFCHISWSGFFSIFSWSLVYHHLRVRVQVYPSWQSCRCGFKRDLWLVQINFPQSQSCDFSCCHYQLGDRLLALLGSLYCERFSYFFWRLGLWGFGLFVVVGSIHAVVLSPCRSLEVLVILGVRELECVCRWTGWSPGLEMRQASSSLSQSFRAR